MGIRFAVSTTAADAAVVPTVRVREVRVLSEHVNLREPVLMGSDGDDVTVTFAHRPREGETFTVAAASLEARAMVRKRSSSLAIVAASLERTR